MTGKGRELADMMERRKVDILCVQETRWKGSKARSIGAGFKLFYYGVDSKRNGVGVVLKEEFVRNVLEVKRVSDRVMSLKLEIEGVMLNVVSGYAPQVGCELEEKERFWSELDEVMESIPTGERVVIGADYNGHVGEGNTGDEEVMGKFGVKERNLEGQMVVDFAKRMDMAVVNTYFQKREEHRVTYKSGEEEVKDREKTKWWKLKKEDCCEEFRQKLRQALSGQVVLPDDWETTAEVIMETGRKVLGVSSGRRKEDKETWWWNEEVHYSIQRKRLAKKKWDMDRTEENRQEYKELQRRVKREVSKAKQKAYDELYTRLDTREGEKDLYRLARQRDRDGKDVQQVRVIKDRDGRVLTSEESVQRRWKEYFEELMNEENEREKRVEGVNSVEQKVDKIRKDEVRKALKRMKSGKAVGPDDILVEVWTCLGEAAVEFLTSLFSRVLESERMPEEWRRSVLVPIFKNKGDVQSCSNYRGIKLMSHTMKLWERVVEARLRKVVDICEQQYGFMPRKSTTDAIFALRILMEKYRDGQRELHCVFVDLEKAYDRVPREELWYCMRKSGVAKKYVRVVQDMYERSRTVVRCAVGQTEEFKVEVGLHQGSALSPFLFAIVMDQLSEEVRQESPWTMMFADDIVICSESREQVEENLERWRFALERRGMKVSRSKTEYMCVNEREGSGTVRLQGEEVKKVQEFKYLGSTVQSNGECGKEVKKRVQAGWNGWRKVSGVLCDRKISVRIKGKVYRTVVRPAMLYGLETVSLRKRQESELEVAELKMLRFSLGVTRLDRIRNEYIRGTAHVGRLGDKVREARLRWFGHVQRRENLYNMQVNPQVLTAEMAEGIMIFKDLQNILSGGQSCLPETPSMDRLILSLMSSPRRYAALSLSDNSLIDKNQVDTKGTSSKQWYVTPEITITDNDIKPCKGYKAEARSASWDVLDSKIAPDEDVAYHETIPLSSKDKTYHSMSLQQSLEQLDKLLADLVIDYKPPTSIQASEAVMEQLKKHIDEESVSTGRKNSKPLYESSMSHDKPSTSITIDPHTIRDTEMRCDGLQNNEDCSPDQSPDEDETMMCSNNKCRRTETLFNACLYFKSCHSCYTYYCSRNCRREDWAIHKESCLYGRIGSICRHIIKYCRETADVHKAFSRIAKVGYLSRGRGVLFLSFPNPGSSTNFLQYGLESLLMSPTYLSIRELDSYMDNLGDYCKELQEAGKDYDPNECFLLNVSIAVGEQVPERSPPRVKAPTVRKYAKVALASYSPERSVHGKEREMETLILTPPPVPQYRIFAKDVPELFDSDCTANVTRPLTDYRTTMSTTISPSDSLPDYLNTTYAHIETFSDNTERRHTHWEHPTPLLPSYCIISCGTQSNEEDQPLQGSWARQHPWAGPQSMCYRAG
ncbi:hypothetical protein QTP70_013717 [Hemibagrus guttatus]|uniref:ribonuclease H n=1 Tax=Hemibagrus guttatus TaxID=175788 RepID=A0AAE0PVE5_9TELE|nr:hypothetical protein QTP70_013717 [Hemibagrus guttatus]